MEHKLDAKEAVGRAALPPTCFRHCPPVVLKRAGVEHVEPPPFLPHFHF